MKRLYLISYIPSNEKDRVNLQVNEIKDVIEICSLLTRLNESFTIKYLPEDRSMADIEIKIEEMKKTFNKIINLNKL